LLIIAYVIPMQAQELYKNEDAPLHERIMDLLSRLTVEEKVSLLRATSPGVF
jgi:beta-glucosidase